MVKNSKEYAREYMRRHANEKVECEKCHKVYPKYSKYKHDRTKYHLNYDQETSPDKKEEVIENEAVFTIDDIKKLKAFINLLETKA